MGNEETERPDGREEREQQDERRQQDHEERQLRLGEDVASEDESSSNPDAEENEQ